MRTKAMIVISLVLAVGACTRRAERERAEHEKAAAEKNEQTQGKAGGAGQKPEGSTGGSPGMTPASRAEKRVMADFRTAEGQNLAGKAEFSQAPSGVMVVVDVEKAPPGKHQVRLYEHADCSNVAGESMGRPFKDEGKVAGETGKERREGDLGVIDVGADGKGQMAMTLEEATLTPGDKHSLAHRSVVILADREGGHKAAGKPIACAPMNE